MIEGGVFKAVPLDLSDPAKFDYLLNRMVEHEQHWTDHQKDPAARRILASDFFARAIVGKDTSVHEVWTLGENPDVAGLIGFTKILPGLSAEFHPVFFDGKLRNAFGKQDLLLRALDWAFVAFDLHRIAIEVPEVYFALIAFARKKLGFRFEGEERTIMQQRAKPHGYLKNRQWVPLVPKAREAEWGSRKFQALYKDGRWMDLILLSVTREEFQAFRTHEASWADSSTDPIPSKPSLKTSGD